MVSRLFIFNLDKVSLKKLFPTMNINQDIFSNISYTECAYLR